jgi:thiamine phosphate synthase YjbQ (UPF0047 family)
LTADRRLRSIAAMTELTVRTTQHTEFVEITDEIQRVVSESGVKDGVCIAFVPHTTARKNSQTKSNGLQ